MKIEEIKTTAIIILAMALVFSILIGFDIMTVHEEIYNVQGCVVEVNDYSIREAIINWFTK